MCLANRITIIFIIYFSNTENYMQQLQAHYKQVVFLLLSMKDSFQSVACTTHKGLE